MTSQPKRGATPRKKPVRDSAYADPIREALADRRRRLEAVCPQAIDLAAAALTRLHDRLHGSMANLAGDRSGDYRGRQVRGHHGLPIEDLAVLMLQAPDDVAAAVDELLRPIGYMVAAAPRATSSVLEENADVMEAVGELQATLSRSLTDGLDRGERRLLAGLARRLRLEVAELEQSLNGESE